MPTSSKELDIRALAQQFSPKAILTAAAIMNNAKVPPATRLQACDLILKRGYGNPITPIANPDLTPLNFAEMSDEMLLANAGRLDAMLAQATVANQVKGNGSVN